MSDPIAGVVPASLSFLAIYNPSLSKSDDTFHEQIVYYYSRANNARRSSKANDSVDGEDTREERNEKERQIGLAQGMVEFAKSFSNGDSVDSIETEKSRIILHELETGWWLLASVDLTRLPSSSETIVKTQSLKEAIPIEYSAREVCPPALLLQQILRAHQIFLLHQASSIAEMYTRVGRSKMCGFLKRFWDAFIWSWDVLLHGNPAVDMFNGLKLAAGGELGIGVGEEDWGSGEREVLEGFIGRTEGLVDLVVARFGDSSRTGRNPSASSSATPSSQDIDSDWQVSGERVPGPADGIIFSGIGALSRPSVRNLSSWMEWLYMYGQDSYGVRDNPSSAPRRKRRKIQPCSPEYKTPTPGTQNQHRRANLLPSHGQGSSSLSDQSIGIPASLLIPVRVRGIQDQEPLSRRKDEPSSDEQRVANGTSQDSTYGTDIMFKYLTLGVYGSSWGIPSGRPPMNQRVSSLRKEDSGKNRQLTYSDQEGTKRDIEPPGGNFLIGLQGQLEEDLQMSEDEQETVAGIDGESVSEEGIKLKNRIVIRTLYVERAKRKAEESDGSQGDEDKPVHEVYRDRLRVVVYIQQPFIFTLLFELRTDALAMPSFYRSLHHQLGPLQRPLLASTSPSKVSKRLWEAAAPKSTASTKSSQPICDLVYDPARLTVHTTIPNIPEPGPYPGDSQEAPPWTRVEALSVHSQMLNTYSSTRRHISEQERTSKTSRQWWVVWMRLPQTGPGRGTGSDGFREAFLIRKASDYVPPAARKSSSRFGREVSGPGVAGGWGPGKLAEGIGIDARQYIEGLLSLNR
ncbi:MAG: hypothetical protein ASARMPREDX12_000895 [Alectoria sarmentosa]|nr:MAG: hypothetical protein ASARMPREDX12_000895 [Alectoria sarmentosa]